MPIDDTHTMRVDMMARVVETRRMARRALRAGDTVPITRMDTRDGAIATDRPGTWGHIGRDYELTDEESTP